MVTVYINIWLDVEMGQPSLWNVWNQNVTAPGNSFNSMISVHPFCSLSRSTGDTYISLEIGGGVSG